ncbi:MAG: cysteine protease [uncultured bacterium]|nr:MAG: cysteine protease [uncultured bacterium]
MFKKSLLAASLTTALLATQAQAFEFDKPIQVPVTVTKSGQGLTADKSQKEVTIMRVILSQTEKDALAHRNISSEDETFAASSTLPRQVNLGMNDVPVLDQGRHGSCVTFAVSGAVDAVLGKGDYVSQLCNLELGSFLDKYGYTYSGWEGSYGPVVLEQMMRFGIVSKKTQRTKSCANVTKYPLNNGNNIGNKMSLTEFKPLSENLNKEFYWTHLYSNDQLFDWPTADKNEMKKVLMEVKKNLANGNRLTFGTFLIIPSNCHAGACATHNKPGDTWALTKGLDNPPYEVGGHEMVIFGYDDNAVAYEPTSSIPHKGLLFLRNSWGNDVGDNGNYYMTYDFFMKYANEVQAIVKIKK